GGPSAHLGRTVREPTRDSASSLERSRSVRTSGPDCPPAHQSFCKLSGTGADCPPLWRGLSAVTQSALELSLFQIFSKRRQPSCMQLDILSKMALKTRQ